MKKYCVEIALIILAILLLCPTFIIMIVMSDF